MKRFSGKVALVTGGGSGIGLGTVRRLADEGASVAVADLNHEAAEAAVSGLRSTPGFDGQFSDHGVDVSSESSVNDAVAAVLGLHGRIDVLVNAAGVASLGDPLSQDKSTWDWIVGVNLTGTYLMSMAVIRSMVDAERDGSIVNITSIAAEVSNGTNVPYAATKGGVRQLTCSMAMAFASRNIRVNAVAPGVCDTPMTHAGLTVEANREKILTRIPLRRFGTPDDIAAAVAFLASHDASYITGSSLYVEGGMLSHSF